MPSGRVKWFSLEKGFGFISNDEGEDVILQPLHCLKELQLLSLEQS